MEIVDEELEELAGDAEVRGGKVGHETDSQETKGMASHRGRSGRLLEEFQGLVD